MRSNRNKGFLLTRLPCEKYLTKGLGTPFILRGTRFGCDPVPEFVFLRETGFDGPLWEEGVYVGFIVAVVAGVDADSFAEELFDEWGEGCAVLW